MFADNSAHVRMHATDADLFGTVIEREPRRERLVVELLPDQAPVGSSRRGPWEGGLSKLRRLLHQVVPSLADLASNDLVGRLKVD